MLLLLAFAPAASAKGLVSSPPASIIVSKNYSYVGANDPVITSDELSAIAGFVQHLGTIYDSTWRPAILSMIMNYSRSLNNAWLQGGSGYSTYFGMSGLTTITIVSTFTSVGSPTEKGGADTSLFSRPYVFGTVVVILSVSVIALVLVTARRLKT
jgi:hypothetical protein